MLVKICGVRDPLTARLAAQSGADFIGMILTPGYIRSVDIETAKEIAAAAREGGSEPVAVFVSEAPGQVIELCVRLGVRTVQYYMEEAELPEALRRFRVNNLSALLREGLDFMLFESGKPGTGTPIDPQQEAPKDRPFILAGGLHPGNVGEQISRYRPIGVDVSSGVEEGGEKSIDLIVQFIKEAKRHDH
jgi:phosphoribosylanthranilate isomerase